MKELDGLRGDIKGGRSELGREKKRLILKATRRKIMRHHQSDENIVDMKTSLLYSRYSSNPEERNIIIIIFAGWSV